MTDDFVTETRNRVMPAKNRDAFICGMIRTGTLIPVPALIA
jgi:hypothetical protein